MSEHQRWFWRQDWATRDRVHRGIDFSKRLRAIIPIQMAATDFRVAMILQRARRGRSDKMPQEMTGRRIPYDPSNPDPYTKVTQPGDYYGPDNGNFTGGIPSVWFLLPIARDDSVPDAGARALHHICSPPHVFREEPDGSLTARESIGAGHGGYYWHGYLTEGRWELNKSKL